MKKNIYMFLSHIGIFQSFLCLLLILSYILDALFPSINFSLRENNCFNLSIISIYFISSFVYIFKYRPMKVENIKRSVEYKKIISGLFEKDDISVLDRANIRLKTFALFMMALICVFVIVLSLIYLYSHFEMLKRMVDKRKDNWFFSKLIKVIEFYTYYHKYVIKLNTKKNKRSKSHVKTTFT